MYRLDSTGKATQQLNLPWGHMRFPKRNKSERGAVLIEFALLLPLFLLLLMGMVEFGLLFYNKQVVTNSSREGARAGIAHISESDIVSVVESYCNNRLITFASAPSITTTVDGELGAFGTPLTVTVNYDYTFVVPELIGLGTTLRLNAETMMRMERPLSP